MKPIKIFSLVLLLFFFNCEKVIEVDVPSITPKLIIDATFDVYFDENPITADCTVKLTLSADYFDQEIPEVTNATVFLTNLSDNTIIAFSDENVDGNYRPSSSFVPKDDVEYELTIVYNNETYKGKATKIKSAVIDSIQQGDDTLFSGDEIELEVQFTDNAAEENYYMFDFSNNLIISLEDRFFNGKQYPFSYYLDREDTELPSERLITLSGISKEFYTYFRILQNQSGQNGGGPFQSVPSSLLGNIVNTTTESNFPLGYFHISETDTFTVSLVDKN